MQTYIMFGKYSVQSLQGMSVQRTQRAKDLVQQLGGEIEQLYATLGDRDLLIVAKLPDTEAAMKASVALTKLTGIALSTAPAVSVEAFDKLMSEL